MKPAPQPTGAAPQKNGTSPTLGHELFWVVAGMMFSMAGGLLTIKILANILTMERFGEYMLLFSIASFLISVMFTTLGQINLRYVVIAREAGRADSYRAGQHRAFLALVAVSVVVLIPAAMWVARPGESRVLLFLSLLFLTFTWGKQISEQFMLMAFRLRREIGLSQIFGAIGRPAGVLLGVLVLGQSSAHAILGLGTGFLALFVAQNILLNRRWPSHAQPAEAVQNDAPAQALKLSNYLSYGATYTLIGLATITVLVADRWLLSIFGTLQQVAIYAALMQVALAPVAFSHAVLSRLAAPILFSGHKQGAHSLKHRQFTLLLAVWGAISLLVLLGATLLHGPIVTLLTNAAFAEHSYLLPWMVLGLLLERSMQVLELKGSVMLKTQAYMYTRISLILGVPVLELLFLRLYGFDWLVMGLVAAAGLGVAATLLINTFVLTQAE